MKTGTSVRSPRDCLRTRNVSAPCDVCGARPEVVHIPINGRGSRCSEHCENCTPAAVKCAPPNTQRARNA
jgi:hypothetical protein